MPPGPGETDRPCCWQKRGRPPLATFNHRITLEMHGGVRRISSDIVVDQRSEPTYDTYTFDSSDEF